MDSKKIGTFKQFLKQQRQKRINEQKLSIEIAWWDECIVEVMQDLKDECNGFLDYDTLIKYVKGKNQILGKTDDPGYDEALLLAHIKDLIFQHHGDSLYTDGGCSWGDNNPEVQAKGLAVGELAKVILDKVLETIKTDDDPIPGTTSATLSDQQPKTLIPAIPVSSCDDCGDDEYSEDLPFEHKKVRPVKKFNDYTKMLKETVAMIDCDNLEDCIQHTLGILQKMVGSLDANEIAIKAYQVASPEAKTDLVINLLKNIVYDYLTSQDSQVKIIGNGGSKDAKDNIPEDIYEQGLDALCDDIVDEILGRLAKENGGDYEAV